MIKDSDFKKRKKKTDKEQSKPFEIRNLLIYICLQIYFKTQHMYFLKICVKKHKLQHKLHKKKRRKYCKYEVRNKK